VIVTGFGLERDVIWSEKVRCMSKIKPRFPVKWEVLDAASVSKSSSGDEIANVNFFTTTSHTYCRIPKREPTLFNKLDDIAGTFCASHKS